MIEIEGRTPELTKRPINPGGEKWLGKPIEVLDHGFVYLVDYMGNDASIEQAARVSYGEGTRPASATTTLLRYMLREDHTSPFEMPELKFHAKMPIFVARQWVRHRTASINEYSARYSIVKNEFYTPVIEDIAIQSIDNKQGRGTAVDPEYAKDIQDRLARSYEVSHSLYKYLLDRGGEDGQPGIARELARIPLPLATYTEWYWKCDLRNLLHFLDLRMDPHAQLEIRQYANAMSEIVKDMFPITWKAFEDYQLEAVKFSKQEKQILGLLFSDSIKSQEEVLDAVGKVGLTNKREIGEFIQKLNDLGLTNHD